MKTHSLFLLTAILLMACTNTGKRVEASFFTEGNCPECGELIRKALVVETGVEEASWSMETGLTTVIFDPELNDLDQLQQRVASQGFETQYFPADPQARTRLPECCRQPVKRLESVDPHAIPED